MPRAGADARRGCLVLQLERCPHAAVGGAAADSPEHESVGNLVYTESVKIRRAIENTAVTYNVLNYYRMQPAQITKRISSLFNSPTHLELSQILSRCSF
jgi:hypothetical protein